MHMNIMYSLPYNFINQRSFHRLVGQGMTTPLGREESPPTNKRPLPELDGRAGNGWQPLRKETTCIRDDAPEGSGDGAELTG